MTLRSWFLLACLGLAAGACGPRGAPQLETPQPVARREAVRDTAVSLMARFHVPGLQIASIRNGHVEWVEAIGETYPGGAPVTRETVFQAASLGKPLFAFAVIRMADEGRIDLLQPIARDLPPGAGGDAARDPGVTPARLLSHTSGIALDAARDRLELAFEPGERWAYSGAGYALLQRAVEHVNGEPLDPWMQRTVFAPLGMANTSYLAGVGGSAAMGHTREGGTLPGSPAATANVASTLHTTASDYAKFLIAAMAEERMRGPRGMASAELQLGWGLGFGIAGPPPVALLHWGSNPGFKSLAMAVPGNGTGFVILSNGDNGLEVATALAPLLLGEEYAALEFYMLHPDD